MKISKELYTFFKEWLEWAEGDGKDHAVFGAHTGLCSNLDWWHGDSSMEQELYELLDETFGEHTYPFGYDEYLDMSRSETQHLCPKRLAFVREQISKYECTVAASEQP